MTWVARGLGHEAGAPDTRDIDAIELLGASSFLPDSVPRLDRWTQTLDQGPLPTCVTNAVAQAIRVSELQQLSLAGFGSDSAKAMIPFMSRLFPFFFARSIEGPPPNGNTRRLDVGTTIRNVFKCINRLGFPPEDRWAYDNNNDAEFGRFARYPSEEAVRDAYDQRTTAEKQNTGVIRYAQSLDQGPYERVDAFKRASSQERLTIFATQVTQKECSDPTANNLEPIGVPNDDEPIAGGHCMVVGGYDALGAWVLNSWGTGYGDGGWCKFSWDRLTWKKTGELWIVERAPLYMGDHTL